MRVILFVMMAHMVGDYLFQSDYLAMNKGKDNYILLAHSVLYLFGVLTVSFFFDMKFSYNSLFFIGLMHFIVDYLKARGISVKLFGEKKALIIDQLIHYFTLLVFI